MGDLQRRVGPPEAADVGAENAESFRIALFRVAAEDLHADADTEDGLGKGPDQRIQTRRAEARNSHGSIAHAGQDDFVRGAEHRRIGRQDGLPRPAALQCVQYRPDIAGLIVHDRDHNMPLLLGMS